MRDGGFSRAVLLAGFVAFAATPAVPQEASQAAKEKPAVYDEKADAEAQVTEAVARARKENKRVLLTFGGNWCGWCVKLHGLINSDAEIKRLLLYEYEQVRVDVGRFDKNMGLAAEFDADLKSAGVPYLVVLDGDRNVVTTQERGSLEEGAAHDPAKVKAFLEKWKTQPLDAEAVLDDALSRAKKEEKRVFLHFGAPW
jgi:thiol:disulfide interchange protein